MNVLVSIQHSNLCTICRLVVAEHTCNSCINEQFCSKCYEKEHAVSTIMRKHQRLAFGSKPSLISLCPSHPDEKLKYCCRKCNDIPVCHDCILFKHKDHDYALIDDVAKEIQTKVNLISALCHAVI